MRAWPLCGGAYLRRSGEKRSAILEAVIFVAGTLSACVSACKNRSTCSNTCDRTPHNPFRIAYSLDDDKNNNLAVDGRQMGDEFAQLRLLVAVVQELLAARAEHHEGVVSNHEAVTARTDSGRREGSTY